jgi:hypothetical protein
VQPERMVISPRTIQFAATDSVKTISVTHTCTCPFTWWTSVPADAGWLQVPASMQGDHAQVPITVDRTKMTSDSVHAFVRFTSNAYGIDSLEVIARR